MEMFPDQIFYKDDRKLAIMIIDDISGEKFDKFRNFNMILPSFFRRRFERSTIEIDLKSIYLFSPEKDLFSYDIDFEIIVYCENIPSSEKSSIFCKKLCAHFEKYIITYYTDLNAMLSQYPEAMKTKEEMDRLQEQKIEESTQIHTQFPLISQYDPFPTKIQENLYLGDAQSSLNINFLREKNITAIVTVMPDIHPFRSNPEYSHFRFHHIPIHDKLDVNICEHIYACTEFIQKCHFYGINVYVHCAMGISRSVSFVIAYLMQTYKITFQNAYKIVKEQRPQADPNMSFICQLIAFEKHLFNQS
jgi:hypothetical protein